MVTDTSAMDTSGTPRACYDWDECRPSTAVVEFAMGVLDRSATSLTPLYDVVEPDALDRLLTGAGAGPLELSFTYEGLDLSLHRDGTIEAPGRAARPFEGPGTST
jgi:hypothetical protein